MDCYETKQSKRFNIQLATTMAIFLLLLAVQTHAFEHWELTLATQVIFALLPVVPLFAALMYYRRFFLSMDEYMKKLTGEALIWTCAIVGFGTFIYGMLDMKVGMPEFNIALILPGICIGQGLITQILLKVDNREE